MTKKLYRSRSNAIVAGVCGGIAEFFGVNAGLVRLLFLLTGVGTIVYLLL